LSVEQIDTIDIASRDLHTGEIVLTISDHLDWAGNGQHLLLLQAKLNTYSAFIESGEVYQHVAGAEDTPVIIRIVCKYVPDSLGKESLTKATQIVESAGFTLWHEVHSNNRVTVRNQS